jgi:hypothetical protein
MMGTARPAIELYYESSVKLSIASATNVKCMRRLSKLLRRRYFASIGMSCGLTRNRKLKAGIMRNQTLSIGGEEMRAIIDIQ